MKKCLNCGELNENSIGFCSACGTSDFEEVASVTCPNCKKEVKAGADFCTECGTKLQAATLAEVKRNVGAVEAETFDCPHCSNAIPVASVDCPYCGEVAFSEMTSGIFHSYKIDDEGKIIYKG